MKIAKVIREHLKEMYSSERNISRIIDLYKQMFSLKKGGRQLNDYNSDLKRVTDGLDTYQSLVFYLKVLQQYREELLVVKFLTGPDAPLTA